MRVDPLRHGCIERSVVGRWVLATSVENVLHVLWIFGEVISPIVRFCVVTMPMIVMIIVIIVVFVMVHCSSLCTGEGSEGGGVWPPPEQPPKPNHIDYMRFTIIISRELIFAFVCKQRACKNNSSAICDKKPQTIYQGDPYLTPQPINNLRSVFGACFAAILVFTECFK